MAASKILGCNKISRRHDLDGKGLDSRDRRKRMAGKLFRQVQRLLFPAAPGPSGIDVERTSDRIILDHRGIY